MNYSSDSIDDVLFSAFEFAYHLVTNAVLCDFMKIFAFNILKIDNAERSFQTKGKRIF